MRHVVLIENDTDECGLIRGWIGQLRDTHVLSFPHPDAAGEALEQGGDKCTALCIVLDVMFPGSLAGDDQEAAGLDILHRYPEVPTVLITQNPLARKWVRGAEPLLALDKPPNLFPKGGQDHVKEFRRDLLQAVECGLRVASLRAQVAELKRAPRSQPLSDPPIKAAILFFIVLVASAISARFPESPFVHDLFLSLTAAMGVHLIDRAVLYRKIGDAFESVIRALGDLSNDVRAVRRALDELSMDVRRVQGIAEDARDRPGAPEG